jgi:uncharacterized protein (DUF305 family)
MAQMLPRWCAISSVAVVLTAGLVACGSGDSDSTATTVSSAPGSAIELNDADVEFAQGMIAHHEQAIEMAEIALDPNSGASAAVLDLATRIRSAQDSEVMMMTAWLTAAGKPMTMDTSGGHDMSSMAGMMSMEDMDALARSTGTEFDRMWLEMMIQHHEGAIIQAEEAKANGSYPEVLALADEIISAQLGEIAEMRELLAQL